MTDTRRDDRRKHEPGRRSTDIEQHELWRFVRWFKWFAITVGVAFGVFGWFGWREAQSRIDDIQQSRRFACEQLNNRLQKAADGLEQVLGGSRDPDEARRFLKPFTDPLQRQPCPTDQTTSTTEKR